MSRPPFVLPDIAELDLSNPAVMDLALHAEQLREIVQDQSSPGRQRGLELAGGFRIYCFERRPDGAYHMLDRRRAPWRGHRLAFSLAELDALGVLQWARLKLHADADETVLPMASDPFQNLRGRRRAPLLQYAELIARIASATSERKPGTRSR